MESTNLIKDLLNADNTTRQRAETQLNESRTSNPGALMQPFMTNMRSGETQVAMISCVLFKKYFLDNSEGITQNDYEQMKQAVMDSLDFKTQPILLLKRKGDVLSKIFSLQQKNEELLGLLVQWAQTEDIVTKQFAMYVFEILSECHLTPEQLSKYKDSFFTIFEKTLQETDIKVKVAAVKATTTFLTSITEEAIVNSFSPLMQPILNIMVEALKADEEQGKVALESMVELTKTHPQAWKDTTAQLVTIISDIVRMKDFEEGTRSQAAEVVLTLASQSPATLRKLEEAQTLFFPALVQMLAEIEEDNETWAETIDGEDGTGNDVHSAAIGAIGRFSLDMKQDFILSASKQVFAEGLQHADWKIRQAGFMTFGLIAESCRDYLKTDLNQAMQIACSGVKDAHPRVRYAGLTCLALVLTELSPIAQIKFHQELVPALLSIMKEEKILKIRTHALSCMINFTSGLIQEDENEINETQKSSDILNLYSDALFSSLIDNLKAGISEKYEPLQEEVLNLLNVSATLIEDQFAKYFSSFMPLMVEILENVESKTIQQMNLRARTFESIGFMIAAVSDNEEVLDTVKEVTSKLFIALQQQFAHDDPQEVAIKEALTKVAFYLKGDFNVIAPKFLEILIVDANLDIDIKQENAELPSSQANTSSSFEFKLKGMEDKTRVTLNTSALGNKIAAFQHIMKIAEAMGEGFQPYIATILPVLKAHIGHFSKAIRKASLKTFQYLLIAQGEPHNLTFFKEIYGLLGMGILKAHQQDNVKEIKLLFKEMYHCMKVISQNEQEQNKKFFASAAQMQSFGALMKQCLNLITVNKEHQLCTIEERNRNGEIDAADEDEIKLELYKISGAATYINECADIIMSTYKGDSTETINDCVKFYMAKIIQEYKSVSERELQDALFFFMEFVEHCASTDFMMIYELTTQFTEITCWCKVEMIDVRQNLAYGIGVMAKHMNQQTFKGLVPQAMQAIEHILSNPDGKSELQQPVTENAYVSLAILSLKHTQEAAHVNKFLEALPLQGEEEAQEAHKFLFEEVLQNNAVLMGECKPNMLKAVMAIKEAQSKNEGLLTEEGVELMNKVLSM